MGGLIARYYLRYGIVDLNENGSLPELIFLVAGDSESTNKTAQFDSKGRLAIVEKGLGDGVVLRKSALMDERLGSNLTSRLISPIKWRQVLFLFSDHLDLTRNPAFTDNVLFFLMESQGGL